MSTKPVIGFRFFILSALSLCGGFIVTVVSVLAGGIYSSLVEPGKATLTDGVLVHAILVSFGVYLLIISGLLMCMAQKKEIAWKLYLFFFLIAPLTIFVMRRSIHPELILALLTFIASIAVYQVMVIRYAYWTRT